MKICLLARNLEDGMISKVQSLKIVRSITRRLLSGVQFGKSFTGCCASAQSIQELRSHPFLANRTLEWHSAISPVCITPVPAHCSGNGVDDPPKKLPDANSLMHRDQIRYCIIPDLKTLSPEGHLDIFHCV